MEDSVKPILPPLWLLPNQWKMLEEAGYDMRFAKRTPLTIPTVRAAPWKAARG